MATSIGNLAVVLSADTSRFARQMSRATQPVRAFTRSVLSSTRKLAMWGGALTGVGGAAGLIYFIKREYEAIDATGKMAMRLGIATEALSSLHYAARLAGLQMADIDKSLQYMLIRIAESAKGLGEARQAFEQLGLQVALLAKMEPDQALFAVAQALEEVQNQTVRAELAYSIFGRSGVALLQLLADGTEGLRGMMNEARKLGVAFSDIDYAQIAAANDAITRIKAAIEAIIIRLSVALAPVIEDIARKLIEAANSGMDWGKKVQREIDRMAESVRQFATALRSPEIALKRIEIASLKLQRAWKQMIVGGVAIAQFMPGFSIGAHNKLMKQAIAAYDELDEKIRQARRELEELKRINPAGGWGGAVGALLDSFSKFGTMIEGVGDMLEQLRRRGAGAIESLGESIDKTAENILKSLREAVVTFGYTARQIQLHRLVMAGATQEQVREALQLIGILDKLEAAKKEREAAGAAGAAGAGQAMDRVTGAVLFGSAAMWRIFSAQQRAARNPLRRMEQLEEKVVTNTDVIARAVQIMAQRQQPQIAMMQ